MEAYRKIRTILRYRRRNRFREEKEKLVLEKTEGSRSILKNLIESLPFFSDHIGVGY